MTTRYSMSEELAENIKLYSRFDIPNWKQGLYIELAKLPIQEQVTFLEYLIESYTSFKDGLPTKYELSSMQFGDGSFVVKTKEGGLTHGSEYIIGDLKLAVPQAKENLETLIAHLKQELTLLKEFTDSKKKEQDVKDDTSTTRTQKRSSKPIEIISPSGATDIYRILDFAIQAGMISSNRLVSDIVSIAFRGEQDDDKTFRNTLDQASSRNRQAKFDEVISRVRSPEFREFAKLCALSLENSALEALSRELEKELTKRNQNR